MSLDDILKAVRAYEQCKHVVVTGGEPLVSNGILELVTALVADYHVTVETAGTHFIDLPAQLFSISPKLSNSTPSDPVWRDRHEARRSRSDVVQRLMKLADYQLKFVVTSRQDLEEISLLLGMFDDYCRDKVFLMPEGRSIEEIESKQDWIVEMCKQHGYRFGDRLHIRLFGNARGT